MSTRVDFAFGAAHRLRMACEVTHKHYLAGRLLVVYTRDARRLGQFDRLLWSFDPTAFVPHVYADDPMASSTPVILTQTSPVVPSEGLLAETWLINLDLQCPPQADAFPRILEIVSQHDQDKEAARVRWLRYKEAGYELHAHDVSRRS